MMRRFFISSFERILSVLTILSVLAVAALAARIAVEAQPGETRAYLTAAAVLVGGWLAVVAVAGTSFLAIAMHDNSRRLIGLLAQGTKAARPLTATRQPERAAVKPRPAPTHAPDHDRWDDEGDLIDEPVATAPKPPRTSLSQQPVIQTATHATPAPELQTAEAAEPAARSVFTGRAMPRVSADHPDRISARADTPAQHTQAQPSLTTPLVEKAPVIPAPAPLSSPPSTQSTATSRLVAERRFPR